MSGIRKYPYSLKLAMQATHDTPQTFYGMQTNLRKGRKRSATGLKRKSVLKMLERIGLR